MAAQPFTHVEALPGYPVIAAATAPKGLDELMAGGRGFGTTSWAGRGCGPPEDDRKGHEAEAPLTDPPPGRRWWSKGVVGAPLLLPYAATVEEVVSALL